MDNQKKFTKKDMLQFRKDTELFSTSKWLDKLKKLFTRQEITYKWFEEFETKETRKIIKKL